MTVEMRQIPVGAAARSQGSALVTPSTKERILARRKGKDNIDTKRKKKQNKTTKKIRTVLTLFSGRFQRVSAAGASPGSGGGSQQVGAPPAAAPGPAALRSAARCPPGGAVPGAAAPTAAPAPLTAFVSRRCAHP